MRHAVKRQKHLLVPAPKVIETMARVAAEDLGQGLADLKT